MKLKLKKIDQAYKVMGEPRTLLLTFPQGGRLKIIKSTLNPYWAIGAEALVLQEESKLFLAALSKSFVFEEDLIFASGPFCVLKTCDCRGDGLTYRFCAGKDKFPEWLNQYNELITEKTDLRIRPPILTDGHSLS